MKTTDIIKYNSSYSQEELQQLQIIFKGLTENDFYRLCTYQGNLLSVRQIRTAIKLLGKENVFNGILQDKEKLENYIKSHSINLSDIFGMEYLNFTPQIKENLYSNIVGSKENNPKGELLISAKLPTFFLFDTKKEITKLLSNDKQLNQIAIEAINKNDPGDKKFFWLSKEISGYIGEKIVSYRDKLKANKIDLTNIPEKEITDFKKYISANIQSIIDQGLLLLPDNGLYDFMPHIVSYRALKEKHISNILNNDDSLKQFRELLSGGKFQEIEGMFAYDEKKQSSVETKNEANIIPQSIFDEFDSQIDEFRQKKEKSNGIKYLDEKQEHIPNEFQNEGFQVTRATQTGQRTPEVIDIYLNNLEKRPQHFSHAIGVLYIQNLLKKGEIKITPEKILSLGSGPHEELRAYINAHNQGNIDNVPDVVSLDMSLDFLQKSKQKTPDLNKYIQGTMLYSQKDILDFSNIKGSFDVIGNMGKLEKFSSKSMDMIECSSFDNLKNNQENELKDMLVNSLRILKQDGILKFYLHKKLSPEFVSILQEHGIHIINEYDESMSNYFKKAFIRYGLFLATKDKEIDIESFKNDIKYISIYDPTIRRKSENNTETSNQEENQETLSQNIIKVINNDLYTLENPDILKSYIQYLEKHNELTENIIIQLINAYFNKKNDLVIQNFLTEYFKTNSLFLKHFQSDKIEKSQEESKKTGKEIYPGLIRTIDEYGSMKNDSKEVNINNKRGFNEKPIHKYIKTTYNENGFDKDGLHRDTGTRFNREGFTINGLHRDTGTRFNRNGFDKDGFDKDGFDEDGIHKDTGTPFDGNGFDKDGFDKNGIHKDTGTRFNKELFGRNGLDKDGYNRKGRDIYGFDRDGFNENGFDKNGIHKDTGTRFNKEGFGRNGIHKDTGTRFNKEGSDKYGNFRSLYDKYGNFRR